MREDLKRAIEQGQNFSAKFQDDISISLMVRKGVYFLPEAIRLFADIHPEVQISPKFQYSSGGLESFLKNETDILFALEERVNRVPGVDIHKLFTSKIYLITMKNDPLLKRTSSLKRISTEEHLWLAAVLRLHCVLFSSV